MASTIHHWKRGSRIGIVSRLKIIRELGEWSGAKKTETNFQCCRRWRETLYDLGNVHDCNNGISSIHGKELPDQLSIHCVNTTDLTLKCSTYFKNGVWTRWDLRIGNTCSENYSWKYLSLPGDERIINLRRTKVYVFSDSVLCLGKILQNPESNDAWEQILGWLKSSQNYSNSDRIDGEPMEFEWNIFSGFKTLQLSEEV